MTRSDEVALDDGWVWDIVMEGMGWIATSSILHPDVRGHSDQLHDKQYVQTTRAYSGHTLIDALSKLFCISKGSELRLGLAACASCYMQSFIVSIREEAYGRPRLYVVCDKACIMYIIHTSMGCGVQEGRRAHITLHSLIGRLLRRAALRPGR